MKNIWSGLQKIVMLGASMLSWRDRYLRRNEPEEFLSLQSLNQHWTCLSSCGRYTIYFSCKKMSRHSHLIVWHHSWSSTGIY